MARANCNGARSDVIVAVAAKLVMRSKVWVDAVPKRGSSVG